MKFKWALKNSIRNHVIANRYTTMDSLVDSARDQELHQADFRKQREMENQKRKRDDDSSKFQKNGGSAGTIMGILFIGNRNATVLFDTGVTHSFVSTSYVKHLYITPTTLSSEFSIGNPIGVNTYVNSLYHDCVIIVDDRKLFVDLLPIPMQDFDVILGMDWLEQHKVTIDCQRKKIIFGDPNSPEFEFQGSTPSGLRKFISVIKAKRMLTHGCEGYLAHVIDSSMEPPKLVDVNIVCEFPDVFPEDLDGLPPQREVEFSIDLLPGAQPISKAPYRMAPLE
ncbi:uncharacterized protein LOC141685994 [Apium graveolens]|uniref:uncharacterized protein LOC141685994 n=1 Tax=Apium graveolens TaxID=4045 RepID=UPI003D7BCA74